MRYVTLSLIGAALYATPALAQQKMPLPSGGPDIVVTGTSLKEAQRALKACLDQHCPPDKDIDATLAVAETQFVDGDYRGARATMLKSIGRNKRFAAQYPVPVSDLLRANARVAAHLGERDFYFTGATGVVAALKAGLPDTDPRVLGAEIELADAYAKTGRLQSGIDLYRKVARQARTLHYPSLEGFALLRVAVMYVAASSLRNDIYYDEARKACDGLIARSEPDMTQFVRAATLLKAKLAIKHGDPGAVDRLIASYRATEGTTTRPVLLYAPRILPTMRTARDLGSTDTLDRVANEDFENQWVDVSFEVGPDGKVTDIDVLRTSPKVQDYWVKPIVTALAGRRYAPLAPNSPGAFRVERYTYTAAWTNTTGTRLRVRSDRPQLEVLDLSRDPDAKTS